MRGSGSFQRMHGSTYARRCLGGFMTFDIPISVSRAAQADRAWTSRVFRGPVYSFRSRDVAFMSSMQQTCHVRPRSPGFKEVTPALERYEVLVVPREMRYPRLTIDSRLDRFSFLVWKRRDRTLLVDNSTSPKALGRLFSEGPCSTFRYTMS